MFLLLIPIFLLYFHATDTFDQDLGRHLKLGEIIWQTHSVPKTNLLSYTNPNEPVLNSHWLSQVIFYLVHRASGVGGLILLSTIVNAIALGGLLYFAARRVGPVIPSLVFIPFLFIFTDRSWVRPEMFGNLFYALVLVALFSLRVRSIVKWLFPIIALLWINLHVTWILGVFSMLAVLLQDSLEKISNAKSIGNWILEIGNYLKFNILILVLIGCVLLINPYGWSGVISALNVLQKYGYTIVENQSLWFLKDFGFSLVGHIFLGLVVLAVSYLFARRRPSVGEMLVLGSITILTLRFVRNEVLFVYTAFLVVCFNLSRLKGLAALKKYELHIVALAILVSSYSIVQNNNSRGLNFGTNDVESYRRGIDFYQSQKLGGPILNNFDIGGYLIYRLYPQQVFIDNRPEAYPVEFFSTYKQIQEDVAVFDQNVKKYGVRTIIWSVTDITPWSQKFLASIAQDKNWKQVYLDRAMVILTKE